MFFEIRFTIYMSLSIVNKNKMKKFSNSTNLAKK